MAEWRLFKGWSDEELLPRLEAARALPLNFSAPSEEMTLEAGWSQVSSESQVGRERAGPPEPGGLFERSRQVLETFDFSDPRIVRWHFLPSEPLPRRLVLLELKALGLRYLCPVRVGGERSEHGAGRSIYGFSFETLEGHIEAGREWFLLTKDHASGAVRFHIEASWRLGDFPNAWSRLGFRWVGRRYQRAWHRLTHLRLRELARNHPELLAQPLPAGPVVHSGHKLEGHAVQFFAQKALGRRESQVEVEVESISGGRS